jgi:hypothetical protein
MVSAMARLVHFFWNQDTSWSCSQSAGGPQLFSNNRFALSESCSTVCTVMYTQVKYLPTVPT